MTLEKTLVLETGRSVKVITQHANLVDQENIELDILIKEPKEEHFRPPIGVTHPKYWKLKNMDPKKSRLLQLRYSGLSAKQVRKVVRELRTEISVD